jgi:hypothetical protein
MLTFLKSITFAIALIGTAEVSAGSPLPNLDNYAVPAEEIFTGAPAPVNLNSYIGAARFKTKLVQAAQNGPNYAGHYTIVTIGCGTQCQDNWLIDAKTGKILDKISSMIGVSYAKNSYLLIVNPFDEALLQGYKEHPDAPFWTQIQTIYQIWKENNFKVVKQMPWTDFSAPTHNIQSSQPNSEFTGGN